MEKKFESNLFNDVYIMVVRVVEFSIEGTKVERFLAKNQLKSDEIIKFENWSNGELSKIGHQFRN